MKCHISLAVPMQGSLYDIPLSVMGTPIALHSDLVISLIAFKPLDN